MKNPDKLRKEILNRLLPALLLFMPLGLSAENTKTIDINNLQYSPGLIHDSCESALTRTYRPLSSTLQMEKLLSDGTDVIWIKSEFNLPPDLIGKKLAVLTGKIIMADEIYLNGHLIGKNGSMSPKVYNNWNHYRYYTVERGMSRDRNILLIKAFGVDEIDIRGKIKIGLRTDLEKEYKMMHFFTEQLNFHITILLLSFSIFPFVTWIQNKKRTDALYFTLVVVFYSIFSTNYFTSMLFDTSEPPIDNLLQQQITFISLNFTILFLFLMMRSFLKQKKNHAVTAAAWAVASVINMFYVFSPDYAFFKTVRIFSYIPIFSVFALLIFLVVKEIFRKNPEAVLFSLCLIPMFIIMIHDMVFSMSAIYRWNLSPLISFDGGTIYFMSYGGSLFLIVFSLIATLRYTNNLKTIENMNRSLEKKIQERTNELFLEKNKLENMNYRMLKELDLARKIQEQLMPAYSPAEFISSFYFPVSQVGGDLYEFIEFDDGRIGIFISDVSGHGVPSAFITLMIKAILLETGNKIDDPSVILVKLNNILHQNTGGHYITAIYGIYDPEIKYFRYSTAGHYPPLILSEDGCVSVEIQPSYPLAMMSSEKIRKSNKNFQNAKLFLKPGNKLLLFTDGFIDAKSGTNPEKMFQYEKMNEVLMKHSKLRSREFTDAVYADLNSFAGKNSFDDDICFICIDVL
ncbi:MAG: SpoIIE family protein phosphatase [Spirochaetes bacterium]|nr:SpoIIE family protein phosphatase [Spirochaetota bacterium]